MKCSVLPHEPDFISWVLVLVFFFLSSPFIVRFQPTATTGAGRQAKSKKEAKAATHTKCEFACYYKSELKKKKRERERIKAQERKKKKTRLLNKREKKRAFQHEQQIKGEKSCSTLHMTSFFLCVFFSFFFFR